MAAEIESVRTETILLLCLVIFFFALVFINLINLFRLIRTGRQFFLTPIVYGDFSLFCIINFDFVMCFYLLSISNSSLLYHISFQRIYDYSLQCYVYRNINQETYIYPRVFKVYWLNAVELKLGNWFQMRKNIDNERKLKNRDHLKNWTSKRAFHLVKGFQQFLWSYFRQRGRRRETIGNK